MFRGAAALSLDDKGRLAIPAKYRKSLLLDCDGQMVCTIDIKQPCLLLYPLPQWQLIEQKLTTLSSMNPRSVVSSVCYWVTPKIAKWIKTVAF